MSDRGDNSTSVFCKICGIAYILPEDDVVGNLPQLLLCGHIFCAACLRSLEFKNVILCPDCKVESTLPEGGVEGLQVDSRVIGLIYTAKMNKTRSSRIDRQRLHKVKPSSPVQENSTEAPLMAPSAQASDIKVTEGVMEDALLQASKNMAQLRDIHQTLVKGLSLQVKKEKARLQKELDQVMDEAYNILHRRKVVLLSELTHMEQHFPFSRRVLGKVEERMSSLETAMQRAKQVHQFPSLESYCHLDSVLETLQAPVDVQSFEMYCLSQGCGLSWALQQDVLMHCLKISSRKIRLLDHSPPSPQLQERGNRKPFRRSHTPPGEGRSLSHRGPMLSHQEEESLRIGTPALGPAPSYGPGLDSTPNVIIEEIIEEDHGTEIEGGPGAAHRAGREESPVIGPVLPQPSDRHKPERRKAIPLDVIPANRGKVLQEWVVVTHVENPNHFYVRHVAEKKSAVMLSKKINSVSSGERCLFTTRDLLKTGSLVFVKWKEDAWCRAVVTEMFKRGCLDAVTSCPAPQLSRIRVYYQDYGFSKNLSLQGDEESPDLFIRGLSNCLRKVDVAFQPELRRWPPQAIKCSLKDIVPADQVKGWTAEATDEFRRVASSTAVEMHVFAQDQDFLLVDLKKAPTGCSASNVPLSLQEYLVFLDVAKFYSSMAWNASTMPCGRKPLQYYPPVYPCTHLELNAMVSHINDPSHFYIQLMDNMEFWLLTAKLQEFYGGASLEGVREEKGLELYCPDLDQACVALSDDKTWYRATVIGHPGGRHVEVSFVDFGNKKVLSVNHLRKMKDEFFALPAMALRCCLADVLPLEQQQGWSEASTERFITLLNHKLVTAVATKVVPRSKALPVRLFLSSKSGNSCIADLLVTEELARFNQGVRPSAPQAPMGDAVVWDPPFEALLGEGESESPERAGDEARELQPRLVLPPSLKDLRVRVTHVSSPGSFHVQLACSDGQIKRLYEVLKQEYARSEPSEVEWQAGMFCAAYINGVWERAQLCSAVPSSSMAQVLRCDFGNKVKLHVTHLRPLLPHLEGSLALECTLTNVRPAGGRSSWTATACDFISEHLTGVTASITIQEKTEKGPVPVCLVCSNRAGQEVSIADFLVSEGLALKERKPSPPSLSPPSMPTLEELPEETQGDVCPPDLSCSPPAAPRPAPRTTPGREKIQTQLYRPPELPLCGHTQMSVSAVGEDGIVYAMTLQAERQFEQLRERLQQHMKTLPRQKPYTWKSVLGCAVMGPDMLWYRGQVLEVIGGHVKVRYVDQGLVENIPVCHVYPALLCDDVPQLCVPCQLHGVIPVGKVWQLDAVALLKELLLNRCVDMQLMDQPEDPRGCLMVQVYLQGLTLSRIMVHHQHASMDQPASADIQEHVEQSFPDLDDWDMDTEGLEAMETVLGGFSNPSLPEEGQRFRVTIKHLRTPNEVFLSPLEQGVLKVDGETLEEALNTVNAHRETLAPLTDFPLEAPCLVAYSDGLYYRAEVLGFAGLNPLEVLVRHVDYGSDDTLPINKLRQIPPHLLMFPCKALKVRLAGFQPPRVRRELERLSYSPKWSMKAALEMVDLLHGNITASVTATEPELSVFLYDENGALVHLPLLNKGLADYN
ncbi:RING finger protein 17 [Hypomesus transpacificus]|uniref:RING finger protein 17 n=1 Tax=Hypomesus transpacificus TaxID=137520 RepID=UPI001F07FC02|nr:RING finger protein 17 [Hypomesus transpacificus]